MTTKSALLFLGLTLVLAACTSVVPGAPSPAVSTPGAPGTPGAQTPVPGTTAPGPSTSPEGPPIVDPASLNGRQFIAVKVTDDGIVHGLVPGTIIRITFGDGTFSASGGCNTMSGGAYTIVENRLNLAEGAVTEIGCDPARHAQDDWLFTFLGSKPLIELDTDGLILTSGVTEIELLDKEVAAPDQPLVGPTWTLSSIITGDAVSSVPQGITATIKFNEDGTVEIRPGCNTGSGTYAIGEFSIDFNDLATTDIACDGPPMSVEAAVLAVLSADSITYSIDSGNLTIMAGANGLQFSAS
jgi:heat shock protein HslJ